MRNISVTKFKKDLKHIIGSDDAWINLYLEKRFVGTIRFDDATNKTDVLNTIKIEKIVNEYDYVKDDNSTRTYIAIWIENKYGYCYYEFDEWDISEGRC